MDLTDAGLRERLIQEFFAAFQAEAVALVRQKALSHEDCAALVSSFARLAADQTIALLDAARAKMAQEIRAVSDGQLTYCGEGETPCKPGICWGCDVARILDAALRAQGETR